MHENPTLTSCNVCQGKVASNAASCPHCGAPVGDITSQTALEPISACPACNASIADGAKFCTACGSPTDGPVAAPTAGPPGTPYNALYCSSDDKQFFGLCGGIAHKMNMDPSAVRIITCLVILFTAFVPFVVYCVMGLSLPKLPTKDIPSPNA